MSTIDNKINLSSYLPEKMFLLFYASYFQGRQHVQPVKTSVMEIIIMGQLKSLIL